MCVLIHACRVIARVPEYLDLHRCVEANSQTVRAIGILDAHV